MTPRASHARVLVLDRAGRLLLAWRRDPASGRRVWEPPGGAIEPGEEAAAAAERELLEETGIVAGVAGLGIPVHREYSWKGEWRVRDELVFVARVDEAVIRPQMPTEAERATFVGWRWFAEPELATLGDELYPPRPFALLASLPV